MTAQTERRSEETEFTGNWERGNRLLCLREANLKKRVFFFGCKVVGGKKRV